MSTTLFNLHTISNSRLAWIDMAKGIAIILVVYRHIMIGLNTAGIEVHQYYNIISDVCHSFRMPLFFILSGIFIRESILKRSNSSFIYSKYKTLIYPYLVWTTIQITIQIFFADYINANRGWVDYLYIFIHPRAIDHFWFIYALFNLALVYLLLYKLYKGNKLLLLITGLVFLFLSSYVRINLVDDVLHYFVFVAIGDIASSFVLNKDNYNTIASIPVLLILGLSFLGSQLYYLNYEVLDPFVLGLIALLGTAFTFSLSFRLAHSRPFFFLRVAGYHSLYIYLLHVLVSAAVRVVLMKILHVTDAGVLALFCTSFAIVLPIIFYNFCLKYNLWFLFRPPGGNRKIEDISLQKNKEVANYKYN